MASSGAKYVVKKNTYGKGRKNYSKMEWAAFYKLQAMSPKSRIAFINGVAKSGKCSPEWKAAVGTIGRDNPLWLRNDKVAKDIKSSFKGKNNARPVKKGLTQKEWVEKYMRDEDPYDYTVERLRSDCYYGRISKTERDDEIRSHLSHEYHLSQGGSK